MKKNYAWILAPVIVAVVAWLLLVDNEEQKVLDRLEQIRSLAEVRDQENPLSRLGRAKQIGTLFSAQTRYDLTTLGHGVTTIGTREELTRRIAAGRSKLVSLELGLLAPDVQVDGDRARVNITGTALGAMHGGEGRFMDVHRIEIELVRADGDWLVSGGRHIRDERAAFSDE
ncbi:MAG: SnoaL-like domain-containing protein [Halobacteria archaeon]|nr:SnoaL-like domain-containing protein [Halobacteria archaeon]